MSIAAPPLVLAQLVARNVVPLAGILFFGWSAQNALVLYFVDTLLAFAVLFAGVLRKFAPPVTDDGWAARLNGEAGMIGGGIFVAAALAVPLGVPLVFMLGGRLSVSALLADPMFTSGVVWQVIAALWSYVGLWRALQHATPEALGLKRRFALVFLRWIALVMVAYTGIGMLAGSYAGLVFVAIYIGLSIFAEIAPDRFLRIMPGGAEDATPPAVVPNVAPPRPRASRRSRRPR